MYRKEKKIPTILALFILFLGIGGVSLLNQTTHQLGSKAQVNSGVADVSLTNISDASFTISWFTASPALGTVIVDADGHFLTYLEDADNDNIARPRTTHFTTIKNLKENTSYLVKIISGDKSCKISENCPAFVQKTANRLTIATSIPAAHGSIVTEDNKPADNAIVYITIGKSPPLSSKTDSLGLWAIPLTNLRTGDLLTRPNLADNDIVQIIAKIAPDKKAEAITDVSSIRQNLTIPPLQIGKSYNLIDLISKKDLLASLNKTNTLGLQTQIGSTNNISSTSTSKSIDILFPARDDDTTTDNQPRFRGIAPAKGQLILIVNSAPQTARVIAGSDGTWGWRPPFPLEPGTHHMGISGYDQKGNYISLTRRFIVLKSGERVLGEATASATLTPTTAPSVTPTLITPTLISVPSPTYILLPSPTITLSPVVSISIIPTATPIIPPKTGSVQSTILFIGAGASLLLLGLKILIIP